MRAGCTGVRGERVHSRGGSGSGDRQRTERTGVGRKTCRHREQAQGAGAYRWAWDGANGGRQYAQMKAVSARVKWWRGDCDRDPRGMPGCGRVRRMGVQMGGNCLHNGLRYVQRFRGPGRTVGVRPTADVADAVSFAWEGRPPAQPLLAVRLDAPLHVLQGPALHPLRIAKCSAAFLAKFFD